jgi:hypothetical protein
MAEINREIGLDDLIYRSGAVHSNEDIHHDIKDVKEI